MARVKTCVAPRCRSPGAGARDDARPPTGPGHRAGNVRPIGRPPQPPAGPSATGTSAGSEPDRRSADPPAADRPGPGSARRRRRPSNDREAEIVAAGIEVFARKGYAGATIQDVAERVGVLKGSLYYYIDSKEDLLERVFASIHAEAAAIVEECRALDVPPLERLRAYVERYVLWYLDRRVEVGLYFREWHQLTGERHDAAIQQRALFERFIRGLIEEARADGAVPASVDARHATSFVLGAVNSIAGWYRDGDADAPEVVAASYARMAVGVAAGPPPG